jgi:3-oxoacyl-[acyl-carrier-protein] synthase III
MNRAGLVPSRAGRGCDENVDLRAPKRNFFARHGTQRFKQLTEWAIRTVIVESLAEAGIQPDDPRIRAVAVPRMNDSTTTMYRRLLGELVPAPVVPLQAATGHLSCADVLANAADLQSELLAAPGHIAIILNVGGGYTWSSLIVEASPG